MAIIPEEEAAIGEYAVDIKNHQFDLFGALLQGGFDLHIVRILNCLGVE